MPERARRRTTCAPSTRQTSRTCGRGSAPAWRVRRSATGTTVDITQVGNVYEPIEPHPGLVGGVRRRVRGHRPPVHARPAGRRARRLHRLRQRQPARARRCTPTWPCTPGRRSTTSTSSRRTASRRRATGRCSRAPGDGADRARASPPTPGILTR